MTEQRYLLDNAAPQTGSRFHGIEALFDATTFAHLAPLGVGEGWRCLEIGAGGGSVARWIAGRVGSSGSVLATDLNVQWLALPDTPNVEGRVHDIVRDPLPSSEFDLIHARLVLSHIPERAEVLAALVTSLRPGGWLLIEDFDSVTFPFPVEPLTEDDLLVGRVLRAFTELLHLHGADTTFARTLPKRFRDLGLADIGAEGRQTFVWGGSVGAALHQSNLDQTGDGVVSAGLASRENIDRVRTLLDDPSQLTTFPLMLSVWGRLPS